MSRTIPERLFRLKRLRASLAKDLDSLDHEIAALEKELRASGFKPRKQRVRPNASQLNDITVGDAAAQVLRRRGGRPMRLTEIEAAILERRLYRTKSTHFRSTLAGVLTREERFERVGRGLYRLTG